MARQVSDQIDLNDPLLLLAETPWQKALTVRVMHIELQNNKLVEQNHDQMTYLRSARAGVGAIKWFVGLGAALAVIYEAVRHYVEK